MLDELGERYPASRVHVQVTLVRNVLLVDLIGSYALCTKAKAQQVSRKHRSTVGSRDVPTRKKSDEFRLKLLRKVVDMPPSVLSDYEHLPQMRFGLGMALETVLVSTLFLADLAVPPQALKPL